MAELEGIAPASLIWEASQGKGLDDLLKQPRTPPPTKRCTARQPDRPQALRRTGASPVSLGTTLDEVQSDTAATTLTFIKQRRANTGKFKVMATPPGGGKSTAVAARPLRSTGATTRILVPTHALAQEYAERYPSFMHAVSGRNEDNCRNFPLVEAARAKAFDVSSLVCKNCPFLTDCRKDGYYSQFEQGGTLVAPAEMLHSGEFMKRGEVVILDDVPMDRIMIERHNANAEELLRRWCRQALGQSGRCSKSSPAPPSHPRLRTTGCTVLPLAQGHLTHSPALRAAWKRLPPPSTQ